MKETPFDRRDPANDLGEQEITELLRAAGPGDRVPDDELAPIRAKARDAWRAQVRRTAVKQRATRAVLAIAAVVVLVIAIVLLRRQESAPAGADLAAATVETVVGTATIGAGRAVAGGDEVAGGDTVTTADASRVALLLADGSSVRIDVQSSVRVASGRSLRLDRGALYVDTRSERLGPGETRDRVEIETPFGTVTDQGTRFEVRLLAEGTALEEPASRLAIRVRDGAVRLATPSATYDAAAGSVLTVRDKGEPERSDQATYGDEWSWVDSVRPPVAIEGITCTAFLDWAARESGRSWRFADPANGLDAGAAIVHGSIEGFTVEEALETVLPSCGLRHRIEGSALVIDAGPG